MAKPLVPWVGGKRRLAKQILPLFPEHTTYVEPFAGAGAMLFAKEPSKSEILNDINSELITLYRVVQHHLDELLRQFEWALASRDEFERWKRVDPTTLTDIQRAARFIYLQKLSYGAKAGSQLMPAHPGRKSVITPAKMEKTLRESRERLTFVTMWNSSWEACIKRFDRPSTLFYVDPPYVVAGLKGMYGMDFTTDEHQALANALRKIKGKAIVSINDCPEVREIYKGYRIKKLSHRYSLSHKTVYTEAKEIVMMPW